MKYWFFFILSLMLSLSVSAKSKQQIYDENAAWAQQQEASLRTKSDYNVNVSELCAESSCVSQVNNPSQSNLTDSEIETKARIAYDNDDTAQAVQENFNQGRPNVKTDPAYEYALLGQQQGYEISHGISNKYVDCDNKQLCNVTSEIKICNEPTNNLVTYVRSPSFDTITTNFSSYTCPAGYSLSGSTCYHNEARCYYGNGSYVEKKECSSVYEYFWQGRRVHNDGTFWHGETVLSYRQSCGSENFGTWRTYNICKNVSIASAATPHCPSGWTRTGDHCSKKVPVWPDNRPSNLIPQCGEVSSVCTSGPGTRNIEGIPTYLDCWQYTNQYLCKTDNTCTQYYDTKTILSKENTCSLNQLGSCVEDEVTLTVEKIDCDSTELICGEQSFCLDGDCYSGHNDTNNEFAESAAKLAAVNAAGKDLGDPPTIFSGKNMQCTDAAFGFADCCADGGWGTSSGLASCNEEEEALGKAKEKKLTIYIGDYCAEKFLGTCIRKKKSYCVYDSKMAQIIQQQGAIDQLGVSLGSPDSAHCDPITPEQLQKINFDLIDFSDFYDDMYDNMNLPDANEIKARVSSALEE